ncbi:MAG: hypothetical protein D4R73_05430 [Deltaproteobacteria bacterium]|nr:MAG: hypothetical protein D4R73_05430 [Deltaproteobacteria bacterium]
MPQAAWPFYVVSKKTPEVEDIILDIAFEIDLKHNVYISPSEWMGTLFLTLHNLFILFHFLNGTGCRTVIMMENAWGT